jgi:hypothetical protein
MTDTVIDETPVATGFIPKARYRRVVCDWVTAEEGSEPLWAEVRSDLPFGVIDDLPWGSGHTYAELWPVIAPHVRAWNAMGYDTVSGTYQPVQPPAEIGPDAFKWVDPIISDWIGFVLKTTYRSVTSDPKASSESSASSGGASSENGNGSASSAPAKASRKNRTA